MSDLKHFRDRVQELYRRSTPYDGRRATQRDLADAIGLSPAELSKRLNASRWTHLTSRDAHAIVRTLVEWGAITMQTEAEELLHLAGSPAYSPAEWQAPPLDQLTAAKPVEPPATRSPSDGRRLPSELSSFVGREEELARLRDLIAWQRLITLTGVGGVGKTRLARQLAVLLANSCPVYFVELASLGDGTLVVQAVAANLGLREQPGQPLLHAVAEALHNGEPLLVLDNCEHLTAAVAVFVHQLLQRCPTLHILTTSREVLRVEGETVLLLPPLGLPTHPQAGLDEISRTDAVRLFVERAWSNQPRFTLSEQNRAAVLAICEQLEGLPLAIELAAARLRLLTVEQVAAGLGDRFSLLTTGSRTVLPRQQTLRALVDWSYNLLTPVEARLFRCLSVFAGGFSLAAVSAVAQVDSTGVLEQVGGLVDKSLLQASSAGDEPRFTMLETLRQYAAQHLHKQVGAAEEAIRLRHASYYLELAEAGEVGLSGAEQPLWLRRLEQEHDNIRAALGWSLAGGAPEVGLRLVSALSLFYQIHGHLSEGQRWFAAALAAAADAPAALRAKALNGAGLLFGFQNDMAAAYRFFSESLTLYQSAGDHRGSLAPLGNLAIMANAAGDLATTQRLLETSITLARELGEPEVIGQALIRLSMFALEHGDLDQAAATADETLSIFKQLGDQHGTAVAYHNLGHVAMLRGNYQAAARLLAESVAVNTTLDNDLGVAVTNLVRGTLAQLQADYEGSRELLQASLQVFASLGIQISISTALEVWAELLVAEGQLERAVHLYAAAARLREQVGYERTSSKVAAYEQQLASLRTTLDDEVFNAAWQTGSSYSTEQAVAYAQVSR